MDSRPPTSRAGFRRNGAQASCETCRKRKTKCDHRRPVCTYCDRNQLQCFYHPAPMSKPRSRQTTSSASSPSQQIQPQTSPLWQKTPPAASPHSGSGTVATSTLTPHDSAPLTLLQMLCYAEPGTAIPKTFVSQLHEQMTESRHIRSIKEVLASLRHLPRIKSTVRKFITKAKFSNTPRFAVHDLLEKLPVTEDQGVVEYHGGIDKLAATVFVNSTSTVRVPADANVHTFCDLFTGPNLRLETIGFLLNLTLMSLLFHLANRQESDQEAVSEMLYCCRLSLDLARALAPQPNDVLLWFGFGNVCMEDFLEGATSVAVWRRTSDLAIDMLSLNVHRESSHSVNILPFFLSEVRKRIFATTNHFDKTKAIELNRQPCIRLQYADCVPPLDISEEQLFSPNVLSEIPGLISEGGWSKDGTLGAMSVARVRYIIAPFEEELLDVRMSPDYGREARLRDLSTRLSNVWDELPAYVKYTPDCWTSISVWDCLTLAILYLDYNNDQFNIMSQLMSNQNIPTELITASWQMLEVVLRISKEKNSGRLSTEDLPIILLSRGVPSASVLLNALKYGGAAASEIQLPPGVQRAVIIQKVSVLISQLDIAATNTEANHFFCGRAAKFVSERLDAVLDPTSTPSEQSNWDADTLAPNFMLSGQDGLLNIPNGLFSGYPSLVDPSWTSWSFLNMDYPAMPDLN